MDDDHFRIGDNDRRRALESLTSLAASGHLTVDEFDERSAAAAIARTRGDVKRLFVLKVGPARWYVPSAGELERRQLKRLRHQKNLQQELEGDANP